MVLDIRKSSAQTQRRRESTSRIMEIDKMQDGAQNHDASDTTKPPVGSVEEKLEELMGSDQTEFNAWTSLISQVEKNAPNDMQKICLVYDSFLSEFPLCYGYWKKYASHKARLCTLKEAEEVYERAVKVAAYSVDLWVSYCGFVELSYENPADVRRLYERGFSFVGKDYLCYLLWDKYIKFEYSQKQWSQLAYIYINTLRFPTKKLHSYYERFKNLVAIWIEETGCQDNAGIPSDTFPSFEMTDIKACGYAGITNMIRDLLGQQDGFCRPNNLKKYISIGELLYEKSSQLDKRISFFETRIRRPYFHVKQLDDCQLENWHQYLDFVEMQGDFDWAVKLYERCLISCANYSEFWIRYVEFVEAKGGREIANYAITRALAVFLKKVPAFHIYSALFKEQVGDIVGARSSFFGCSVNLAPVFIENVNREANMEKRLGNIGSAYRIYENAIELAIAKQNVEFISALYTNFARFTLAVSGSIDDTVEVFIKGIQQSPCTLIIEELIHFVTIHGREGQIAKLDFIVANAISPDSDISRALSPCDREAISKLFLEFVDLYGTIHEIRMAWDRHRRLFPHITRPLTTSSASTTCKHTPLDKSVDGKNEMLFASSYDATVINNHNGASIPVMENLSLKINSATTENIRLESSMQVSNVSPISSAYDACGDSSHDGADVQVMDNPSLKNNTAVLSEENENVVEGTEKMEELAEVVQKQSTPEGTELYAEVNKSVHESHDVVLTSQASSECTETENPVPRHPDQESDAGLTLPVLDNLSINTADKESQEFNQTSSHCNAQEVISSSDGNENKLKHGGHSNEVLANHASSSVHVRPGSPSQENLQKDDIPLCPDGDQTPPETSRNPQVQMQIQEETNSQKVLHVDGQYVQNASIVGSCSQKYYGGQDPEDSSLRYHGYVQPSQTQQWQVPTDLQVSQAATNSQMLISQGYVYQPQLWSNTQVQPANQNQGQYAMAAAAQVYPSSSLTWPGQNIQQQALVYAQPQPGTQPASQPQSQVYQQALQSNGQYGYFQNSQGVQPHMWQYYQQQLYYMQQQQNQQLPSQPQQQWQIEHLQQLQQKLAQQQQQQSQNQPLPNQLQQSQENQKQLNHQEQQQQLSPEEEQNCQQQAQLQQHQSQLQQWNQQVDPTQQQQQHILYLQQQQQQIYLQQQQQQQQLYMQQQQQAQLLQQQLLQQQQQQLLLQHHQHLQQQSSALEPNASNSNLYLQGEGDKIQNTEQSRSSHPSTPQRSTPNQ